MQTFLPYASFHDSALVLDRQRLGKQRVEVLQILRALACETAGWRSHPATRMWRGFERSLALYGYCVCDEWVSRGYRDTCRDKIRALVEQHWPDAPPARPPWFGAPDFHASHRAALLAKAPGHYGPLGWSEEPALDYVWPVSEAP